MINYGGRSIVYKGRVNGERVIIKKTKSNREINFLCKLQNVSGVVHYKSYFFDDQLYIQCKENIRHTIYLYNYITKCNGYLSETLTKKLKKTLKITKEIIHLCEHFTHHFRNVLIPVDFHYVEISECDFSNHFIPKKINFLPCYELTYNYTQFLDEIYKMFIIIHICSLLKNCVSFFRKRCLHSRI